MAANDGFNQSLLSPEISLMLTEESEEWLLADSRVTWLIDFLKENRDQKVLIICHHAETAQQIEEYLRLRVGLLTAVFHEGMTAGQPR